LLFGGHRFCLNLGGIANVSYDLGGKRIAFDICPVNMALNHISRLAGKEYDRGGETALKGKPVPALLEKLNALPFYHQSPPKSLGREWYDREFLPLITDTGHTIPDLLHTVCQHAALMIGNSLFSSPGTTLLTTGGGAFNTFLVELIEDEVSRHGIHVVVPDATVVRFKEAIVFAFLGMLREAGSVNVLSSVTGASRDCVGGAVYKG
jgi:anhydro-N-acetylmuramic acid kinase